MAKTKTPKVKGSSEAQLAAKILPLIGGVTNVSDVSCCMTRLRLAVKDGSKVKSEEIKKIPGVLGLISDGALFQIVLGPGRVRKVTEEFAGLVRAASEMAAEFRKKENAKGKNSEPIKAKTPIGLFFKKIGRWFKNIKWQRGLRHIGNVFSPLVPGFIVFGICYSIGVIINQFGAGGCLTWVVDEIHSAEQIAEAQALVPGFVQGSYWLFNAISFGFLSYLSVFVGINTAKEFGATPAIGGMLGGLTLVPEIFNLCKVLGWQGSPDSTGAFPLALIDVGRGGIFTVLFAVFVISYVEKAIRKRMPNVVDPIFSPLLTVIFGAALLLFAVMPAMGFVSNGITWFINGFQDLNPGLKALCGFFGAGLFLPLIMLGLHHGLTTIYVSLGANNVLYPVFAMNDAAQFGMGMAIYLKARRIKHDRLKENAAAGVIPQALGVSEPLIYGVTLPLFRPFITVAIGAAIGGAFIAGMGLGFNGFDVSGLLGLLLAGNLNGVESPVWARIVYFSGWLIAASSSFIATWFLVGEKEMNRMPRYDTFVNKPVNA